MSGELWTRAFWKGAAERAIKSFGQGALAAGVLVKGADAAGAGVVSTDAATWGAALAFGLATALLSVLTSIANPSFVAGEPPVTPVGVPAGSVTDAPDPALAPGFEVWSPAPAAVPAAAPAEAETSAAAPAEAEAPAVGRHVAEDAPLDGSWSGDDPGPTGSTAV